MKALLEKINAKVFDAGGALKALQAGRHRSQYRELIKKGEIECPEPIRPQKKGKRGRIKKSKSRNLLERLRDFEDDVLRFMENEPYSQSVASFMVRSVQTGSESATSGH